MKTVIFCGGRGTRLGEHGKSVPKALINIGDRPIIWHLIKYYSHYGFREFILCLGYLGNEIKDYIAASDLLGECRITCIDTGVDTNTGGRLFRVRKHLQDEQLFFVTYGDGLSDVDLGKLLDFHDSHGKASTVTTVHPHSTFGLMDVSENGSVSGFREKPRLQEWINGGFFVFNQAIFDELDDDCILEREPFESLAAKGEMMAFRHQGFWKCMDTFKDNLEFEQLWNNDPAWKVW